MMQFLRRILPSKIKEKLKSTQLYNDYVAKKLVELNHGITVSYEYLLFHLKGAGIESNMEGYSCFELGTGWVPRWALIFHILGAKTIITCDVKKLSSPKSLRLAIQKAKYSTWKEVFDFEIFPEREKRFENISNIMNAWSDVTLKTLGIHYFVKKDITQQKFNHKFNFIFSSEVLQYVPEKKIPELLAFFSNILLPGGQMMHILHLEDMSYFRTEPFKFLTEPIERLEAGRGNRVRKSGWEYYFDQVKDITYTITYIDINKEHRLPDKIDSGVKYIDETDLRVSNLVIKCVKKNY